MVENDAGLGVGEQPPAAPATPNADGATSPAEAVGSDVAQRECARCAAQNEVPLPKVPTRDTALGRTVREWLKDREDLRDPQYVDLLLLKAMLRRHYNALSGQLSRNGLLTKSEGKLKQALGTLLDMVRAIRGIDEQLPDPPAPPLYRYVGRCSHGACEACEAGMWEGRGDRPDGEPIEARAVEVAKKVAKVMGLDPEAVIRHVHEVEAERRELLQLRNEVAKLREREAARAREPEVITGDVIQPQLEAPDERRLLPVGTSDSGRGVPG